MTQTQTLSPQCGNSVTPPYQEEAVPKLYEALRLIGGNEALRRRFVALCKEVEKELALPLGDNLRELVTGPIVNALHAEAETIEKTLADGTQFELAYCSKIARDFVLSPDERPDHVFEPQTTKLIQHLSQTAKTVVIGGAYAGDHAILSAKLLAERRGAVHAFEPNALQMKMLRRNAELNALSNLRFNQIGLWEDENTTLRLVGVQDACAFSEIAHADDGDTFPTTTIDAYGRREGIERIDLIMLDIEGAEHRVLKGARHYLEQPAGQAPTVIFEVHSLYVDWSRGMANTEIIRFLTDMGYHVYALRDFQSNVPMPNCKIELVPMDSMYLEGPPHGFNIVAFKDPDLIRNDKFRICENVSPKLLLHREPHLHHPTEWLR